MLLPVTVITYSYSIVLLSLLLHACVLLHNYLVPTLGPRVGPTTLLSKITATVTTQYRPVLTV